MVYAQFQHNSTGWNGTDYSGPVTNIDLLGSDGVYICDGRHTRANQIRAAKTHARRLNANLKKGITGLIMHCGRSFTESKPISKFISLDN